MREGRYWGEEEERRCKLCGWEYKSWEHVVDVCMEEGKGGEREEIIRILEDDGRGEAWLKRLQARRRRKGKEERRERTGGERTGTDGRTMDGNMSE